MVETASPPTRDRRAATIRVSAAFGFALAFALGVYLLLEAARPDVGLISFSFLLILPAAISAFVAYVADPWKERTRRAYLMVPVWLLLVVIVASLVILREGVICVLILSPLWMISGLIGAEMTYRLRRRIGSNDKTYCSALLLSPLLAMQVEPYIPLPQTEATVTRSTVIAATPEKIWPLLRGIPDVQPGEGQWNISEDVIGIPRPLGAQLVGSGVGAERRANWGDNVRFRERVIEWQPERRIGWRFIFDDIDGWKFTDRHLMPDSPYFRVTTGGYTMQPLPDGRTRVTIHTRYWIQTPVNGYSQLWGELFLGDLEDNLLTLVKGRARAAGSAEG
ncbi:SRPBCC family protein [Sphingomonas psychrolutea]|uniref:SRPBCC family protein n=1 Tax=Sphingomonas psychrolutea TaxID=1259676 RepID=A0ABQ1G343_9SPHN|nr:SRPBCC family protein [Sphingomonas psychrolutea]GGA36445.1 hypothetical protein GCM10011395_03430 [Sphingomonas psychrolutea]